MAPPGYATVIREISADIFHSSVYWTDSMIVLVYLQVDSCVITHSWVIVLLESYHTLKPVNGDMFRVNRIHPI